MKETMMNDQIKVYVGRRSMCMGDDANCPNMRSFYLTDDQDEFMKRVSRGLPYSEWEGYLGNPYTASYEEDGVCVLSKKDCRILFKISYACFADSYGSKPIFELFADDWYALIKDHPYLYFE